MLAILGETGGPSLVSTWTLVRCSPLARGRVVDQNSAADQNEIPTETAAIAPILPHFSSTNGDARGPTRSRGNEIYPGGTCLGEAAFWRGVLVAAASVAWLSVLRNLLR
ncbi:hypothetical protein THTE_0568 [Thermogutta terrifontis]|uniref:Uncharacterized protein n=1 Tax=Thermogutta terrifontis TaxID=1331910 RepID=A0A286RB28_9BACT|nr:hypothetical protein [Thermogutta terrifontis]ASV73170.1 hypothetical protein THTE_0568 [Thermogutta terrifontis]